MGASASIQFVHSHFPPHSFQWIPYFSCSNNNKTLNQKIVWDERTQKLGQKHAIKEFESLQHQLESFLFRKQNAESIVTVYDIQLCQSPSLIVPDCMINQHKKSFTVVLQRIPYRLSDIGVLKFQEMIYIMEQCFKGLHVLWIHFGKTFYIDQDTICFNSQGKCKIWINQNLYKNKANIDATLFPKSIIQHIFEILESRLDSPPHSNYYRLKANIDFQKFVYGINFIQKVRKAMNIRTDFIQSLTVQIKYKSQSDSLKAIQQNQHKRILSEQKRPDKLSLKNSKNSTLKKNQPVRSCFFKQQQTQVSIKQINRLNAEEIEIQDSNFLRSTFKSVKNSKPRKEMQYIQYSEKIKPKIPIEKNVIKKLNFKQAHFLSNRLRKMTNSG